MARSGAHVRVFAAAVSLALAGLGLEGAGGEAAQASGFAAVLVDKSVYQVGDPIRLCWVIPAPGTINLTSRGADGTTQVLRSGPDPGASTCLVGGTVGGPPGRGCLVLDYDTPRGQGSVQTCWDATNGPAPPVQPVASKPQLTPGDVSGPNDTNLAIDGAGFQTFSDAAHGVTIFVQDPDGSEVDSDEIRPSADGTLHVVLHTASYAPGNYTVNARYTFVNGVTGTTNLINTQYLTDGFGIAVE